MEQDAVDVKQPLTELAPADVAVARALHAVRTAAALDHPRDVPAQTLRETASAAFGSPLPPDFTGEVQVVGVIERDGQLVRADEPSAAAAFQVYARKGDAQFGEDAYAYIASRPTQQQAHALADRLALVDAHAVADVYEKAVKMARVHEAQVVRHPNSTREDISNARERRADAEYAATINDQDWRSRLAEVDRAEVQAMTPPPDENEQELDEALAKGNSR